MIKLRLMFLTLLLIAGGCQMNDRNDDNNNQQINEQQVKNNVNNEINSKENREIATRLEKAALEVPHVRAADAVVLGKYVFVAVDVDANIDRSQVGSIKYSVSERLQHDPYGKKAVIVADPDIIARLKEVGEDIKAGKPISGIMNELADIAGRIIPEVPEDHMPPDNANTNNQMPAKDQKELQKEQQDQSNHQMTK
ncbi:YhcN/YlaJ family sporulation lipoprotein [Bacillus massiliigorillae]|uniref:YhcN/YlaJ family sporulation lipoprotein n=1 Tax=Bacillus massiliigorillae TaxID=1243664 RepID=UPI0005A6B62B|nr:YhcN/YlaJ family sporulation lipoprotein [Bacillus massiliigorillae]